MANTIRMLGEGQPHARWLHELRSVVSTASVALSMGRRLSLDEAGTAEDVLAEAEQALAQCRELLASASEHVLTDPADGDPVAVEIPVPRAPARGPRPQGRDASRAGRRRSDGASRLAR